MKVEDFSSMCEMKSTCDNPDTAAISPTSQPLSQRILLPTRQASSTSINQLPLRFPERGVLPRLAVAGTVSGKKENANLRPFSLELRCQNISRCYTWSRP